MKTVALDKLRQLCDFYASLWLTKGGYHVHKEDCAIGYLQSFAIRSLCAGHRLLGDESYRDAAWLWAEFALRLQGTQGHADAYNMGYSTEVRGGIPKAWYPADCGDIALAVLSVAWVLEQDDPRRGRLVASAQRFLDYVLAEWQNEDGSVGGYVEDYTSYHYNFWCADARIGSALWAFDEVTSDTRYRQAAIALTAHSATVDLTRLDETGKPRGYSYPQGVYMVDAICAGLRHGDCLGESVRQDCLRHLEERFFVWCKENQNDEGTWYKKKRNAIEEPKGGYHGMLLLNLQMAQAHLPHVAMDSVIAPGIQFVLDSLDTEEKIAGQQAWGSNTMFGLPLAVLSGQGALLPPMEPHQEADCEN